MKEILVCIFYLKMLLLMNILALIPSLQNVFLILAQKPLVTELIVNCKILVNNHK